jgi:prolipoprotein diacylglyceryl transferase
MRDVHETHPPLSVSIGRIHIPVFHMAGYAGFVAAVAVGLGVCVRERIDTRLFFVVVACAVVTFFALAIAVKLFTGRERLVYYHHEIAILATTAITLWVLDAPILRCLDLIVLFIGTFVACGRVGCFMVGCCHGKPASVGVTYGAEHVAAGFPADLQGVRLLPVQLMESVAVTFIVTAGALMTSAAAPGRTLVWYVTAYGCPRYLLESLRGDTSERPFYLGVSEAQWTSLLSAWVAAVAGRAGVVPEVAGGLAAAMLLSAATAWKVLAHSAAARQNAADPPPELRTCRPAIRR